MTLNNSRVKVFNECEFLCRWIYGDIPNKPSPQGLSLLKTSIGFAKLIFPQARFVLCHNNLESSKAAIESICEEFAIEGYDVTNELADHLGSRDRQNSWWKYAPTRLNREGFELVLDNDVVIWSRPPAIDQWLNEGGLLALGIEDKVVKRPLYYGAYAERLKREAPLLDLNAGILGFPPYYMPDLQDVVAVEQTGEAFYTEQGYSALCYNQFKGPKRLIPYDEVSLVHNQAFMDVQVLINNYKGGHFCKSNYEQKTYWRDKFEKPVTEHLQKMIEASKR